jgi:hypothetical protein
VLAPCHPLYLGIKIDEADGTAQSQERYLKAQLYFEEGSGNEAGFYNHADW